MCYFVRGEGGGVGPSGSERLGSRFPCLSLILLSLRFYIKFRHKQRFADVTLKEKIMSIYDILLCPFNTRFDLGLSPKSNRIAQSCAT